jgi:hypothetical protein
LVSYKLLREGLAGYTKDTDYGMISWEQLEDGWTHGVPETSFPEVETRTSAEGWVQAKMSPETVAELTRTPNFITWQGAIWLFERSTPMVYVGEWNAPDFERHTPTGVSTESFFDDVTRGSGLWKHVNELCVYVFRSPSTGRFAAYCDRD